MLYQVTMRFWNIYGKLIVQHFLCRKITKKWNKRKKMEREKLKNQKLKKINKYKKGEQKEKIGKKLKNTKICLSFSFFIFIFPVANWQWSKKSNKFFEIFSVLNSNSTFGQIEPHLFCFHPNEAKI